MSESGRETVAPGGVATGRLRRMAAPVPFVDLAAQHRALDRPIREAVGRILESSQFILGEDVEAFEREFASFCGVKNAVGVGSGLDALEMTLRALEVGRGHEVILPANTFVATAFAVSAVGAKPVLVDVDPDRYTLDPVLTAKAVTKKTRAIIPVHLYGQSAEMAPLRDLCAKKGLALIEDACQAHGAALDGARCGAMSDAGCFSFYPSKNLGALGDGGMVVTDRDDITEKVRLLRNCGQRRKYDHALKGFNSRLDAVQAAVLRVKLRHLPRWNEARRRHASHYAQALAELPVTRPVEAPGASHVYHLYVIRAPRRDELKAHLEGLGISCGIHYPTPIHLQEAYTDLELPAGTYPVSERLANEILSLPIYPEMADSDVDRVCAAIAGFYGVPPGPGAA
jgi:dTDP-4-amino-4,6-dideoxygalactose transaminase